MAMIWTQSLEWEVPPFLPALWECGRVQSGAARSQAESYGPVGLSVGVAVVSTWKASPGACPLVSMRVELQYSYEAGTPG